MRARSRHPSRRARLLTGRLAGPGFLLAAGVCAALGGCGTDDGRPYLEIVGGGFIFNYRLASADYGFVARVNRPLPATARLEAQFEDPDGGAPILVHQPVRAGRLQYVFRSPPLSGVMAGREYQVRLRLLGPAGEVLAELATSYASDVDQAILPAAPTVVGPGYQRPPPAPED